MPVKVYVWKMHEDGMGHASLTLSDGTHISWWPSGEDRKSLPTGHAKKAPGFKDQTLEDDIRGEGRRPDEVITFPSGKLDEKKIKGWWEDFKTKEQWKLLTMNCSTVVYKALEVGGALKYLGRGDWYNPIVWTPGQMLEFARLLEKCMRNPKPVCDSLETAFISNFQSY